MCEIRNFISLTLNLLTSTIVAPPSNASKWQMGFNSAFKGLYAESEIILFSLKCLVVAPNPLNLTFQDSYLPNPHPHKEYHRRTAALLFRKLGFREQISVCILSSG